MKRNLRLRWLVGILVMLAAVFWFFPAWLPRSARAALESPDRFELMSLTERDRDLMVQPDLFHGRRVLGSIVITDAAVQQKLATALRSGAARVYLLPMCFNPRHCIRVTHGGVVTDLLICFECSQAQVWRDDKLIDQWTTTASPQPVFDAVLRAAAVPLPDH